MEAQKNSGRRTFLKTVTSGLSILPTAVLPTIQSGQPPARERIPLSIYDPLLDPRCRRLPEPAADAWPSHWIWYPGQLTAIAIEMKQSEGGALTLPPQVSVVLKSCAGPGGTRNLSGPGTYRLSWAD